MKSTSDPSSRGLVTKPHTHTHTQRCRWKRKEKFPCDNNTSCSQESDFINHLSCSRQQLWSFHLWPLKKTTSTESCFCFYVLALYAIECVLIWEGEGGAWGGRGCLFLIPRSTLSHKDGVIYVSPVFFFFLWSHICSLFLRFHILLRTLYSHLGDVVLTLRRSNKPSLYVPVGWGIHSACQWSKQQRLDIYTDTPLNNKLSFIFVSIKLGCHYSRAQCPVKAAALMFI